MSSSYSLKIILLDSRGYHSLLLYGNEQTGQSPERHGSTNDEKTIPKIITSLPVQIQSKNDAQSNSFSRTFALLWGHEMHNG